MCIPGENVTVDESLTLWKGRLSLKIYLPLKSSKFVIKTFKMCESNTGSLWKYIVYSGADTDIKTAVDFGEQNETTAIVVKLIETLLNKGYKVWIDNYYNSSDLAAFFKKTRNQCDCNITPQQKNVPPPPDIKKQQVEEKGRFFRNIAMA
jgi:hypothetical protein